MAREGQMTMPLPAEAGCHGVQQANERCFPTDLGTSQENLNIASKFVIAPAAKFPRATMRGTTEVAT
jgi:hypothetical protein